MNSSWSQQTCGTHIYVRYANFFAKAGHEVTVFFGRRFVLDEALDSRVKIVYPPSWISKIPGPFLYDPIHTLLRMGHVLKNRYDVIQCCPGHRPAHLLPALLAQKFRGAVIVDEWWEWFSREGLWNEVRGVLKGVVARMDEYLELRSKRYFDGIIPITYTLKNRLPNKDQSRCLVLHGATDAEGLIVYSKQDARRALDLSAADVIVGLCNVCADDHADNKPFLRAFIRFASGHPHMKLLVSGQKAYIETELLKIVPKQYLINIGWQSYERYNLYLSACDCFALPFPDTPRNAGRWPNKIGDFARLRRPIITSPTGDIKQMMEENEGLGFCVDHSEDAYANVLGSVLESLANGNLKEVPARIDGLMTMAQRESALLQFYERLLSLKRS